MNWTMFLGRAVASAICMCIPFIPAQAADGDCSHEKLTKTGGVRVGSIRAIVTQRCIRRVAEGVQVTCDSNEIALSVFCENNGSVSGRPAALVTSGLPGSRTGVCLWSGQVDANIIVTCKLMKKKTLKGDASGDAYSQYDWVPK